MSITDSRTLCPFTHVLPTETLCPATYRAARAFTRIGSARMQRALCYLVHVRLRNNATLQDSLHNWRIALACKCVFPRTCLTETP
jgi:hypothetical protein